MKNRQFAKINDAREFIKKPVHYTDYDEIIKEDSIIELEGRAFPMAYVKIDNLPMDLVECLSRQKFQSSTRANGLKSKEQLLIGNVQRMPNKENYCHQPPIHRIDPEAHEVFLETGKILYGKFGEILPKERNIARATLNLGSKRIEKEYMIGNTCYANGIINKNNPLSYHFDKGNMTGILTCLLVLKNGVSGGCLSLPEYKIAIECSDATLLIFHGAKILHGVSPIQFNRNAKNPYRYSMVFYTTNGMPLCSPYEEELHRAQNNLYKNDM